MPSAFDAIQLAPQSVDDKMIVGTVYSGSIQDIISIQDSSAVDVFLVDANGIITKMGASLKLVSGSSSVQVTVDTALGFAAIPTVPETNGPIVVVGSDTDPAGSKKIAAVNKTNQSADIASTKITNARAAGTYMVWAVLESTTADVTAGVVTLNLSYTDDAGATTNSATTQVLSATGRATLALSLYLASGDITYTTSHTGIFGTAKYALRIRAAYLG